MALGAYLWALVHFALIPNHLKGGGIAGTHAAATLTTFAELPNVKVIVIFWLLPAAISDLIIAIALTYYLRQHKGRFQGSDKVLDKIIRCTFFL